MQCPYCEHPDSKVTDSRPTSLGGIRRRRQCENCGLRFTTQESIERQVPAVTKRSGGHEPFDREKLARTLRRVAKGRPIASGATPRVLDIAAEIEVELSRIKEPKISWKQITELVLARLQKADRIAHERFAAHYRREDGSMIFEERESPAQAKQMSIFDAPSETPSASPKNSSPSEIAAKNARARSK